MAGGVVVLELIEGADTVGSKATDQAKKNKSYSVQMQGRQTSPHLHRLKDSLDESTAPAKDCCCQFDPEHKVNDGKSQWLVF